MDEDADEQRVKDAQRAALGGGDDADADRHDDDQRQHERPARVLDQQQELFPLRGPCAGGDVAAPLGDHMYEHHHPYGHDDPRDPSGQEHPSHRHVRDKGEEDEPDAGRDDRGDHRRGRGHRRAEILVITALQHLRDKDFALGRRVGRRRTGDPSHQRGEQNVDLPERARQVADDPLAEVHQPLGHAGVVEHRARRDEKGHRPKRAGFHLCDQPLQDHLRRHRRVDE